MAVIDIAGFVADLKDHAVEHGFHVHDERHFVESYSLRQTWEVDLHPEEGCEGPVDLYLSLEIDPRVLLGFEDVVIAVPPDDEDIPDDFFFPLNFTWALPPLAQGPDLLVLATELAGLGGPDLPLETSAIDSIPAVTDAPERSLRVVAHQRVSLLHIRDGDAVSCEVLEQCLAVSRYLLAAATDWLGQGAGLPSRLVGAVCAADLGELPSVRNNGWMPMRIDCKHYDSRTYPSGEIVRKCRLDLAPEAPWRCPDDCPAFTKRRMDAGWNYGSLGVSGQPPKPEPEGVDVAALLDEAEDIVNTAAPDILADLEPRKKRLLKRRKKNKKRK